ncbi:MAG: hypothetical protein WCA95_00560 [Opitutaceae bacterium]
MNIADHKHHKPKPSTELTATFNLTINSFNSILSGNNIDYSIALASTPAPSSAITLNGTTISISASPTDTATLTFVLNDPNNLLVGVYFYNDTGGISGQCEFSNGSLTSTGGSNPQASSIVVVDQLGNVSGTGSFTYSYSILVQNNLNLSVVPAGDPGAIGIIDPDIDATIQIW